jgi:hypothetical protein
VQHNSRADPAMMERTKCQGHYNVSAWKAVDLYGEALFDRAGAF